jgi:hypothetical protein
VGEERVSKVRYRGWCSLCPWVVEEESNWNRWLGEEFIQTRMRVHAMGHYQRGDTEILDGSVLRGPVTIIQTSWWDRVVARAKRFRRSNPGKDLALPQ